MVRIGLFDLFLSVLTARVSFMDILTSDNLKLAGSYLNAYKYNTVNTAAIAAHI